MSTPAERAEQSRRADESLNALATTLGARLLVAHARRKGEDVRPLVGLSPRERDSIARATPSLFYSGRGWTAVGECKPRNYPRRLIRGYGETIRVALHDLERQLARFERGERDGEQ